MPTMVNASSISVTVRVSRTGYKTKTVTVIAKVNKAEGKINLSATSGTLTYPTNGTFTVSNNTGSLSAVSNNTNIATVSVSGNTVTVKSGTTAGKATITVTSAEASNYTAKSATYEATVNNGTISLSATPYTGTYDGKAHNALTNVSVNPSDAKLEYSINGGTYSTTMPTVTNSSSFTVTVRASKAGYKTISTTQTVKVNKAAGTLTLSATSGTYTYPTSGTFTVSGNTGTISASSNNTNIATVSISGNTVTVKPGTTAGTATITVTSAEASNYTAKSATYTATVNNGTISLTAIPYTGTYDGKSHNAFTSVSVTPSDAKLEYSTDGTKYSTTMPTITASSSFTVTVRASKTGYKTQTTTQTVKVNKVTGTLTLSATSTIKTITVEASVTYPSTITSDKIGTIEYRFSKDNGSTWSEYQSSGKYTFSDLYDIEEKTYNIKVESRGSNINNIVQSIDVTTKKNEKYYADTADLKLFRTESDYEDDRDFFKKYDGATAAGIMYTSIFDTYRDRDMVCYAPILVSDKESAVAYYSTYNYQTFDALGSFDYNGKKFYYGNREHWVQCEIWTRCIEKAVSFVNTYETPFLYDVSEIEKAARQLLDLYFEE